ncbi:MAG: helix-turn-helix transcriptional regulator [Chloroflexi bacterium]|nr:helix-turn-helix transcriptional regulator [Chloroflexota bacterium]
MGRRRKVDQQLGLVLRDRAWGTASAHLPRSSGPIWTGARPGCNSTQPRSPCEIRRAPSSARKVSVVGRHGRAVGAEGRPAPNRLRAGGQHVRPTARVAEAGRIRTPVGHRTCEREPRGLGATKRRDDSESLDYVDYRRISHATDPETRTEYELLGPRFQAVTAILEARLKAGLSQQALAEAMGTTRSAVSRLESGRHSPSVDTLAAAAAALGCDLDIRIRPRRAPKP